MPFLSTCYLIYQITSPDGEPVWPAALMLILLATTITDFICWADAKKPD